MPNDHRDNTPPQQNLTDWLASRNAAIDRQLRQAGLTESRWSLGRLDQFIHECRNAALQAGTDLPRLRVLLLLANFLVPVPLVPRCNVVELHDAPPLDLLHKSADTPSQACF